VSIKKCKQCGNKFVITKIEKWFCSIECRTIRDIKVKKYNEEHKKESHNWYQKNKELTKNRSKKYRKQHKEELKQYWYKYSREHRKEKNEYNLKYFKNPLNKLIKNLRSRVLHAIKNNIKSVHTEELLGCSIEYLKTHLEKQFKKNMSWNNWNQKGWHIDHIRPCYSFDLSKKSEQLKCFNYSNLQPLWATENLKKGVK